MDKSWIALGKTPLGRMSQPYIDGVTSFIKFAMAVVDQEGKIPCPCLNCVNYYSQNLRNVQIHLLQYGIMQTYTIWHEHREPRVSNEAHHEMTLDEDEVLGGIDALVEDRIRGEPNDAPQNEEVQTFDKLLNDAKREVYLDCTNIVLRLNEWISSEAQAHYENMIQTQADHLSQSGSIPLTAEELSIKVLKPKSGYVKGLGMRPSSSRRTTTISAETNDYVKRLEMEIETQREQIQTQNNKIEELEEGGKKQGEIMEDVVNFLRSKGFPGHFGNGGDSSPSGHTSW